LVQRSWELSTRALQKRCSSTASLTRIASKTISGTSVEPVGFCFEMSLFHRKSDYPLASKQGSVLCLVHRAEQPTCPTVLIQQA
jgi:hypothetical protein